MGAVAVFMISSWITTFTIAMQYKYVARIEEPFALFDELYDKPWLRIGPYLVGMATGYALLKLDYKLPLPKPAILLGWVLSIACLFSLVYGLGKDGLVVPVSAFYVRGRIQISLNKSIEILYSRLLWVIRRGVCPLLG